MFQPHGRRYLPPIIVFFLSFPLCGKARREPARAHVD
jgi:hypothetical protein